jgi:hypothetical protein
MWKKEEFEFVVIGTKDWRTFKAMISGIGFIWRPIGRHRKVLSSKDGILCFRNITEAAPWRMDCRQWWRNQ